MTTVLLIRHASNDYLTQNRMAGWQPIPLNEQGRSEAHALAQRLATVPLDAIYTSPIERARETANIIAQPHQLDVQVHPGLSEVNVGDWTDQTIPDLQNTDAWKQMLARPFDFRFPNGESNVEVHARIVTTINALAAMHPHQIIALVSHADPIKMALAHYLGMDLNNFNRLAIDPASLSILKFNATQVLVYRLNDNGALDVRKETTDA
jgi:probable phosphoglycerate mutase